MVPWTYKHFARDLQSLVQAQGRIGVAVAPAANQEDGTPDALGGIPDRTLAPILTIGLVTIPLQQVGLIVFQVLLPHLGPPAARPLWVRWEGIASHHLAAIVADVIV